MRTLYLVWALPGVLLVCVTEPMKAESPELKLDGRELPTSIWQFYPFTGIVVRTNDICHVIAANIRQELIAAAVKRSGISVAEEVLTNCLDLFLAAAGITEEGAAKLSETLQCVVMGLKDVVISGKPADKVYEQKLKGKLTTREWEIWQACADTPEKIHELEWRIPRELEDIKRDTRASLKRDIELWLLLCSITNGVVPTPEYALGVYTNLYPAGIPPFDEVKERVLTEAGQKFRFEHLTRWWSEKVSKHKIEVPEQYKHALRLVTQPPAVFLIEPVEKYLQTQYSSIR